MYFDLKMQHGIKYLMLLAFSFLLLSGCSSPSNNITRESVILSPPVDGTIIRHYGQSGSRGIDFSTQAGAPVYAAASGSVVYAGSGLHGYGNTIILKHGNSFLTVYAYINELMVHKNDFVQSGQPIAKMGNSATGQVKLYFELRQNGKDVNPEPYLQQIPIRSDPNRIQSK